MAILVVAGFLVERAHTAKDRSQIKDQEFWLNDARTKHEEYMKSFLEDQVWGCLHHLALACGEADAEERAKRTVRARSAILESAVRIVGEGAARGVSANLYRMTTDNDGKPLMVPEDGGSAGRKPSSHRVFPLGHPTMEYTLRRETQFVESYDGPEPYETYMTAAVHTGPAHIYGVLTVDCLKTGELRADVDGPRMEMLALMLAITYRYDLAHNVVTKAAAARRARQYDDMWDDA